MRRLRRLWSTLEAIPGLAAERLEWQRRLEDEWLVAAPYLRSTGRIVDRVWCPSPGGDGCPRHVVRHDDGCIVAVCGDRPKQCDPLELSFDDLLVLEVDFRKLAVELARIFDVDTTTAADLRHGLCRLGEHLVASGSGFPVVLLAPASCEASPLAALPAALEGAGPLVLLSPTRKLLGDGLLDALRARGGLAIPLVEMVGWDDAGFLVTLCPVAEVLDPVRERLIQQRNIKAPEHRFPTPLGTTWSQITIRFITQHQVHIQASAESGTFEYTQMGMANTRKKPPEPNVQWQLLIDFAENRGEVTWRSTAAHPKKQKRKEQLAKALRNFFGIDEEPFETLPKGLGWRACFTVMPEE